METPAELKTVAHDREEITISTREYDEESVIAVDFARVAGEPTVDVLEGTAIVVVDGNQFEFDVPPSADEVTINDNILLIKG